MKKAIMLALVALVALTGLFAQGAGEASSDANVIDTLRIMYVPSREPAEIITATEPLKDLLTPGARCTGLYGQQHRHLSRYEL